MSRFAEFVVFSDFHAHNFKAYSRLSNYGISYLNSRLVDSLVVLDEIRSYCNANGIETVLFGGDLFHSRQAVRTDVLTSVYSSLKAFCQDGIQLIMIPGNHDYANRQGNINSLLPLQDVPGMVVASYASIFNAKGFEVACVPYTDNLEKAKENLAHFSKLGDPDPDYPRVLLAHLGMQGARVGSDYVLVSDGDIGVSDVPQDAFDLCLFGHFHEHQKLFKNGYVIGATHQHNWGDSGGSRGFLHVTIEGDDIDIQQVRPIAPRFMYAESDQDLDQLERGDIVRCPATASDDFKEKIRKQITNIGFLEEVNTVTDVAEEQFSTESLDPNDMLSEWIESQSTELPTEDLLSLGKELLAEATKDG